MVHRKGSVVKLKGVVIVQHEGRVALKANARTVIEVILNVNIRF